MDLYYSIFFKISHPFSRFPFGLPGLDAGRMTLGGFDPNICFFGLTSQGWFKKGEISSNFVPPAIEKGRKNQYNISVTPPVQMSFPSLVPQRLVPAAVRPVSLPESLARPFGALPIFCILYYH